MPPPVRPDSYGTVRQSEEQRGESKSYCKLEIDGGAKKNLENNFLRPENPPSFLAKPPLLAVNMQSHEGLIRRDTSVQVVVMVSKQTITKTLWEIQFCFFISIDSLFVCLFYLRFRGPYLKCHICAQGSLLPSKQLEKHCERFYLFCLFLWMPL